jgi:hypothetical protein
MPNNTASPVTKAPEVSVGLPAYNGERFLPQAIESLLGQTLSDLELIISDNGSTDRTEQICRDYAARDPRVRYLRSPVNRGAVWNWNRVVLEARGRYFKWASANDYCDPRMLETCVRVLRDDDRAVLCYPRTWLVDDDGNKLRQYDRDIEVLEARPSRRFARVRDDMGMNNAQSGVLRLDKLLQTPLERAYPHSDMVLMAELALLGTFRLVPEPLFYRRVSPDSLSRNLSAGELKRFLDPMRSSNFRFPAWYRHADCLMSALRSPISLREKIATLAFAARRAFGERGALWDDVTHALAEIRVRESRPT